MFYKFPDNFLWGAASSGPQTEGTTNKINESIWDKWFREQPERFHMGIGPDLVTDTYNRYKEDVEQMQTVGFNSYRTSIQWSRLIKNFETGEVDSDAVEFYNNYIDEIISAGIEPIIGLYHFDMPAELQDNYGGWESKHVCELYEKYCKTCFELFGDRVKKWSTMNEPIVPVEGGYLYDFHYPNKFDGKLAVQVAFNSILAHAKAVNVFNEMNLDAEIGVVLNITPVYTRSESKEDLEAARIADLFFNRSFMDPMVNNEFNKDLNVILEEQNLMPQFTLEELEEIKKAKINFVGLNYYVPRRVKAREAAYELNYFTPEKFFEHYVDPEARHNPYRDNNEIQPIALYDIAMDMKENYPHMPWYLAELGISMNIEVEGGVCEDGLIHDEWRTDLTKEHLIMLHKAIQEGSNCFGCHQWTFVDNWSWINSHKRRYGFYRLNLETRERELKAHGLWFKETATNNGFES